VEFGEQKVTVKGGQQVSVHSEHVEVNQSDTETIFDELFLSLRNITHDNRCILTIGSIGASTKTVELHVGESATLETSSGITYEVRVRRVDPHLNKVYALVSKL
jgi:hypothetical protein